MRDRNDEQWIEDELEAGTHPTLCRRRPKRPIPSARQMADLMADDPAAWLAYDLAGAETDWTRTGRRHSEQRAEGGAL